MRGRREECCAGCVVGCCDRVAWRRRWSGHARCGLAPVKPQQHCCSPATLETLRHLAWIDWLALHASAHRLWLLSTRSAASAVAAVLLSQEGRAFTRRVPFLSFVLLLFLLVSLPFCWSCCLGVRCAPRGHMHRSGSTTALRSYSQCHPVRAQRNTTRRQQHSEQTGTSQHENDEGTQRQRNAPANTPPGELRPALAQILGSGAEQSGAQNGQPCILPQHHACVCLIRLLVDLLRLCAAVAVFSL